MTEKKHEAHAKKHEEPQHEYETRLEKAQHAVSLKQFTPHDDLYLVTEAEPNGGQPTAVVAESCKNRPLPKVTRLLLAGDGKDWSREEGGKAVKYKVIGHSMILGVLS